MRVILPIAITGAMLADSSIAELDTVVDPTEWNSGTSYALLDRVSIAATHLIYECIQAGTNKPPATNTDYWTLVGMTNRWAMFDYTRTQASTGASPMTFCLAPGQRANSIALNGVVAESITITVMQGTSIVYGPEVIDLSDRTPVGWYSWFFDEFTFASKAVRFNLPAFTDARIYVTLTQSSGNASVAACGIGIYEEIGTAVEGFQDDSISYSSVTRDVGGDVDSMVKRRSIPTLSGELFVDNTALINRIRRLKPDLDAAVAFWFGVTDEDHVYFETFFRQAFTNRFQIVPFTSHAVINLELQDI